MKSLTVLIPLLALCVISFAADPNTPAGLNADEVLIMKHTGGWGAGVWAEFHLKANGDFEYTERAPRRQAVAPRTFRGRLSGEQIQALVRAVADAKDGPAAEDAGVVEFRWRDGDKVAKRLYSLPREQPCADLMAAIKAAVGNAVATAPATAPATVPATVPATQPN